MPIEFNQINLTTQDHVDRRIVYAILGSVAAFVVLFAVFNAVNGFRTYREQNAYQAKIRELQAQAGALAQGGNTAGFDEDAADALRQRSRQANYLIALDLFPWVTLLNELEQAIPPQIVLDRLLPAPDLKSMLMTGSTTSVESITQFQNALGESDYFRTVVMDNMDFGGEASADAPALGPGAIRFDMVCTLNLKALMPEDTFGGLYLTLTTDGKGFGQRP